MAQAIPFIIAGAQAASGVVSYLGAQRTATQLNQNADAVLAKGEYEAAVDFNNALEQENKLNFEKSVVEANRNRALQKAQMEREAFNRKHVSEIASAEVTFGYGGTFDSYVDSLELYELEQDNQRLVEMSDISTSAYLQSAEYSRQQNIINANSKANQRNILYASQTQANSLRNQASQAKLAGTAQLIGSFASAGMGYVQAGGKMPSAFGSKAQGFGGGVGMGGLDLPAQQAKYNPFIARS